MDDLEARSIRVIGEDSLDKLIKRLPNTNVYVDYDSSPVSVASYLFYARTTICSVSTFCFFSILGGPGVKYFPETPLIKLSKSRHFETVLFFKTTLFLPDLSGVRKFRLQMNQATVSQIISPSASPSHSSLPNKVISQPVNVALCLVTRDENIDLYEWIDYHKSIGVSNIIIIENNSSKSSFDTISNFILTGYVLHYSYFSQQSTGVNNQHYAYEFCIKNFKHQFSHMGFLDTDEFIVLKNNSATVIDLVEKYMDYGGLTLNWMFIGSNGHIVRPRGGILRNYNQCVENFHVKSIVNLKYVVGYSGDPHHFLYIDKYFAIDTNYDRVNGPFNPANKSDPSVNLYDVAYINHYFLKSKEDFLNKHFRGSGDGGRKPIGVWDGMSKAFAKTCEFLRKRNSSYADVKF